MTHDMFLPHFQGARCPLCTMNDPRFWFGRKPISPGWITGDLRRFYKLRRDTSGPNNSAEVGQVRRNVVAIMSDSGNTFRLYDCSRRLGRFQRASKNKVTFVGRSDWCRHDASSINHGAITSRSSHSQRRANIFERSRSKVHVPYDMCNTYGLLIKVKSPKQLYKFRYWPARSLPGGLITTNTSTFDTLPSQRLPKGFFWVTELWRLRVEKGIQCVRVGCVLHEVELSYFLNNHVQTLPEKPSTTFDS